MSIVLVTGWRSSAESSISDRPPTGSSQSPKCFPRAVHCPRVSIPRAGVPRPEGEPRARRGSATAAPVAAHRADAACIEALEERDLRAPVDRLFAAESEAGGGAESLDERDVEAPFADQAQEMDVAAQADGRHAGAPDPPRGGTHE